LIARTQDVKYEGRREGVMPRRNSFNARESLKASTRGRARKLQREGELESFNTRKRKRDRKKQTNKQLEYEGGTKLVMPRRKSFNTERGKINK
jgi:hypothetical protein